jgi:hypothetical protein
MRSRHLALGFAFLAITTVASAQASADCTSMIDVTAQDVCQKSEDLFRYMAPQLGVTIAGGNATLGQGGSLGGPGHFALGLRANAVAGSLPQVEGTSVKTSRTADTYQTEDQVLPFPAVDAAIGVFPGISVGMTRIGGVDALVNAYYASDYDGDGVRLGVSGSKLKLGFGARVGVLEETAVLPGVSVTWFRRDLPTLNLAAAAPSEVGAGIEDTIGVKDFSMKTTAWRAVVGKRIAVLGIAVGAGQDRYESDAMLRAAHGSIAVDAVPFGFEMTRTNYFADLSLNLAAFRLVAEVGQVTGGEMPTFNQFDGTQADDSRLYGSVGLRIGR